METPYYCLLTRKATSKPWKSHPITLKYASPVTITLLTLTITIPRKCNDSKCPTTRFTTAKSLKPWLAREFMNPASKDCNERENY